MGRLKFYIVNDDPKSVINMGPIVGRLLEDTATGSLILKEGPSQITFNMGYAYDYVIIKVWDITNDELINSTMEYDHKINQATIRFNMPKTEYVVISIHPVFVRIIGKGDCFSKYAK